jgi:pyruvate ferredoxin oxidoreductase gamma subunit
MIEAKDLIEIRWHGRGGQGAVVAAELVARAAINEGKYASAFPAFGAERRGAPVIAFVRINSKKPIRVRAEIDEPDVVIALDPRLLHIVNVTSGLKEGGTLIINTVQSLQEVEAKFGTKWHLAVINATKIAREVLGVTIVNTAMIGALLKATEVVKIESLLEPLQYHFPRLAERNMNAIKRAYEETLIKE